LPPGEPVYVEPPSPRPVHEMTREAMVHPPPVPVERQRLESLIEDAGAAPLLPTPPPDAGPTFYPMPVRPSFALAAHAPPVPLPFEPVFQIPPAPRPPQRAAQDEESNLAEMAQRLQAALRRPIKPVEPVPWPAPPGSRFASAPAPLPTPPADPTPLRELAAPPATAREPTPDLKVVAIEPAPLPGPIEEEMA
jgi:flagellar protein FliO/FliZ